MALALAVELEMLAENRDGDGVVQDRRLIEKLMDSAAVGDSEGRSAGFAGLHEISLRQANRGLGLSMDAMNWIFWSLLSALFAAATAILAKVGVAHVDSNLATAIRTTVVVVFAWSIALALGKHGEIRDVDGRAWLFLGLSGLGTGLSWLCYFRALQLGPASRVAPLDKLSVVLVMVFAVLFLGEKMSPMAMLGGALIAGGAVVMVMA